MSCTPPNLKVFLACRLCERLRYSPGILLFRGAKQNGGNYETQVFVDGDGMRDVHGM